ncbi:trypco2 family protein [Streptomyces sp. NPDC052095]|uniref:trypco2 family protein n=1 Tax=unclassified Streptomyces TaxID=2593676 RepID=UPI0034510027
MTTIGLAAAIEELRQELYQAQARGAQQQFAFEIEEAQLELLLELRDDVRGEGKVQFGVATAGGSGSHSSSRSHKLTLKLQVKDRAAGGSSPEISLRQSGSWADEG